MSSSLIFTLANCSSSFEELADSEAKRSPGVFGEGASVGYSRERRSVGDRSRGSVLSSCMDSTSSLISSFSNLFSFVCSYR